MTEAAAGRRQADELGYTLTRVLAALEPTTPLGALASWVRELAGTGEDTASEPRGDAPFLTVLLRTQGRRSATVQEALLCLAAQTCDDFDVMLLLHDAGAEAADAIRMCVSRFDRSFSDRVHVAEVSGGGRCRPLNEGARRARGQYLATLDDDDLVLGNWVETFRDAARAFPGHVVRTAVATQRVEARHGAWAGEDGYEVVDRPRMVFALDFDHVDHILDNRTPNNGYAFPRSLVTDIGLRWDESLPVLEDWDHLLTSASICGVTDVPRVTALLRWWDEGEDSKSVHAPELWDATRLRVIDKHDASPLLLDRGTFSRLRTRLIDGDVSAEHAARLEDDVRRLSSELGSARSRLESVDVTMTTETRAREAAVSALEEMRQSRSWRVTAGLRAAGRVARLAKRHR